MEFEDEIEEIDPVKLHVNKKKEAIGLRSQAYLQTFNPESVFAQRVIKDLVIFCKANATTFDADARVHALFEGRREVFLRIQQHLQLTPEQILKILGG